MASNNETKRARISALIVENDKYPGAYVFNPEVLHQELQLLESQENREERDRELMEKHIRLSRPPQSGMSFIMDSDLQPDGSATRSLNGLRFTTHDDGAGGIYHLPVFEPIYPSLMNTRRMSRRYSMNPQEPIEQSPSVANVTE
jgi:hypothetical protein